MIIEKQLCNPNKLNADISELSVDFIAESVTNDKCQENCT